MNKYNLPAFRHFPALYKLKAHLERLVLFLFFLAAYLLGSWLDSIS